MQRRFALSVMAAVYLAALTGSGVSLADPPAPAPGTITTVAGIGKKRYAGDGALATATGLHGPVGLAVDAAGNLMITDGGAPNGLGPNERVLKVFGVAAPGLIAGEPFPIR